MIVYNIYNYKNKISYYDIIMNINLIIKKYY